MLYGEEGKGYSCSWASFSNREGIFAFIWMVSNILQKLKTIEK